MWPEGACVVHDGVARNRVEVEPGSQAHWQAEADLLG
jgi:hypothetical protein